MKNLKINIASTTVSEKQIDVTTPIFAVVDGKVVGMVVEESEGWIIRIGGKFGAYGHFSTREKCMEIGLDTYKFYINIKV